MAGFARLSRQSLRVAALAAVLFAVVAASGPAAAAGVDLAVVSPDITFSNPNPVDGQAVTIQVIVRNFGDTNASGVVVMATETGTANLIGQAILSDVPAQGQAQASISWNVSGVGTKSVTVSVASDQVDANPENNQAVSASITVRARPDLTINSVTFDNPTPPAFSTSVEIRVSVANTGGSNATSVVLALYDGDPTEGAAEIYRTTLSIVPTDAPVLATYTWDITNKGGRHDIYAAVLSSTPAEAGSGLENNVGSGKLLVLTQYDIVVTSVREIAYDPQLNGFLIIRSGGDLTLRDCTFTLLQERDNQFEIIVEDGGRLSLVDASVVSDYEFGLTLRHGGTFEMSEASTFGGSVTSEGGAMSADVAVVEGGLQGTFSDLALNEVAVRGPVVLSATTGTWQDVSLEGTDTVVLDASSITATHLQIPSAAPTAIHAGAGTVAEFYGLVAGPIVAEPGSDVSIFRQVHVLVQDFSGIPIGGAQVDVSFALSLDPAASATTGLDGTVSMWLLTDQLFGSSPQYVGSYLFDATFASYHAQAAANLPFYPTLTEPSNTQDVTVTFPVINPADLFPAIDGDQAVGTGEEWTVGNYKVDGNLRIAGALNVEGGTFTLDQDRDFEKAIVLNGGIFDLSGSTLTSAYKYNIYLFGSSQLIASGTTINANAIVMFNQSLVTITSGSTYNGNLVLPGGSTLRIGSGSQATGQTLWARGGPAIIMEGAVVQMDSVDIQTSADITLNATSLQFTGAAVINSASASSTLTANNSRLVGGTADLAAGTIAVSGTEFAVSGISRLWAGSVIMSSTTVTGTVGGLKPGAAVALYDVSYSSITADPTASVSIYFTLSFAVLDVNGNPVTAGEYAIEAMPNGTAVVSGDLAALVMQSLPASQIRGGVEVFSGNYRLTVSMDAGQGFIEYVVMDHQQTITYALDQEVVPPTAVAITASAEPTLLGHGDNVSITGTVALSYEGRSGTLLPRETMTLTLKVGGVSMGTVDVAANGTYNWTGVLTLEEGVTGTVQITISGTYQGVDGQTDVFVEILVPDPTQLILTLDNTRFEKNQNEDFVVSGAVRYGNDHPAAGVKVRVFFTIPPQAQDYFATADDNGIWSVTIPGRRTASTYSISVIAIDEGYTLESDTKDITLTVSSAVGETSGDLGELTLPILGIVAAAAAGIIAFLLLNAKRRSVNYVECGNCGKPVHEGESKCPSCGVEFEEDIAKCSHCASWIPADADRCPKCNTEFKPVDEALAGGAEGEVSAPDQKEDVRAEVTTTATPVKAVKQPVAVKKKVLKRAVESGEKKEGGDDTPDPFADSDDKKADDLVTEKPDEKKDGDKPEKGLFDDL